MNKPNDQDAARPTQPGPDAQTGPDAQPGPDASPDADERDVAGTGGGIEQADEGAGCLPAIVASTLLLGIAAAVFCGVTTWILFQKRSQIAVRTLQGFVPVIEQSLLEPDDKAKVIEQFETLINEMSAPDFPPSVAAAIMQRIVRLPIPHWGELDALEAYVQENFTDPERERAQIELSRIRHAIQTEQATVRDIIDVLEPVALVNDEDDSRTLKPKLTQQDVREVIVRAKVLADRARIEDKLFPKIEMSTILRQQIETAKSDGGF